jgi:hypothetical protein
MCHHIPVVVKLDNYVRYFIRTPVCFSVHNFGVTCTLLNTDQSEQYTFFMSWSLRSWNQGTERARTYCAVCFQCSISSFRYTDITQHEVEISIQVKTFIWMLTFVLVCVSGMENSLTLHLFFFSSGCPLTQEWRSCWYAVCAHMFPPF